MLKGGETSRRREAASRETEQIFKNQKNEGIDINRPLYRSMQAR